MATRRFTATNEDVIAAVILVATCTAVAAAQQEPATSLLPAFLLNAWTQWWPMVLITAGVVLLWMHRSSRTRLRRNLSGVEGDRP